MPDPCPTGFVELAERLADAAGENLRRYFRQNLGFDDKADESPVTIADRETETIMRDMIAETFPGHGIIGEEHGAERADAEFVWVLDPIDGTKAFISGMPIFGTLIALLRGGRPLLGIIDQPVSRERWTGARGRPTTFNGTAARTAARGGLAESVLWTTSPHMFEGDSADMRAYDNLRRSVKFVHYGGECYQYGMLASGFVDLVVEADMEIYDYCALAPVIEGAGGVITDWDGRALDLESDGRVLAGAGPDLHRSARALLNP